LRRRRVPGERSSDLDAWHDRHWNAQPDTDEHGDRDNEANPYGSAVRHTDAESDTRFEPDDRPGADWQ